jgi:hypothetical protein
LSGRGSLEAADLGEEGGEAMTKPKRTQLQRKMGEGGGGMHNNRGTKEEVRRWRMLMMIMMVVVGHSDV